MNKQQEPYILWLPSWYPNKIEPYNGDFIQRHARAAALFQPIHVVFFTQYGETIKSAFQIQENVHENLTETIVHVPFTPVGIRFLDKIRYNLRFYFFAKKILNKYFRKNGLPSLVHVHVPVKAGNLALWIKKKFGIPFILSEQSSSYLKEAENNYYSRHVLYKRQAKRIFSKSLVVTNVSNMVGLILKRLFSIKELLVINNTVDSTCFRYDVSAKREIFTYIHVSSLSAQKNIFGMLRAFKVLSVITKDWKLILVGPYSSEIMKFIKENELEHLIELSGEVPYQKVAHYMQMAHVFVLFSRHENFPCVVVEALCSGLPVVASDVAGINEAVNASNGILVGSEDERELTERLAEIKKEYKRYDLRLISEKAAEKYSYEAIGKQFGDLYSRIQKQN